MEKAISQVNLFRKTKVSQLTFNKEVLNSL